MGIINKKHPDIHTAAKWKSRVFMSLPDDKVVYFSTGACSQFKLVPGKYLHFDNTDGKWSFFQNEDPDGFYLHPFGSNGNLRSRVINKSLVKMIRSSTRYTEKGVKFMLISSDRKGQSCAVIEIITHKTYDQLIQQSK